MLAEGICAGVSVPVVSFPTLLRQTPSLGCVCAGRVFASLQFSSTYLFPDVHPLRKESQRTYTLDISMGKFAFVALEALDAKGFRGSWRLNT